MGLRSKTCRRADVRTLTFVDNRGWQPVVRTSRNGCGKRSSPPVLVVPTSRSVQSTEKGGGEDKGATAFWPSHDAAAQHTIGRNTPPALPNETAVSDRVRGVEMSRCSGQSRHARSSASF